MMLAQRTVSAKPAAFGRCSTQRRAVRPVAFKEDNKVEQAKGGLKDLVDNIKDKLPDTPGAARDVQPPKFKERNPADNLRQATGEPAFDDSALQVPFWIPAFTRRRELFISRIAALGFLAAVVVETKLRTGIIGQISILTGVAPQTVLLGLELTLAYNLLGGLGPWSPTFSEANKRDVLKRPEGPGLYPPREFKAWSPAQWLGITGFGWSKGNEIFAGRLSMLGIVAAIINEVKMGGAGPIEQVARAFGQPPTDELYALYNTGLIGFTIFALGLALFRGTEREGGEDIY